MSPCKLSSFFFARLQTTFYSRQIIFEVPSIKFHENASRGNPADRQESRSW